MKTYDADKFKEEFTSMQYDIALKELFGDDLLITFKRFFRQTPREQSFFKQFSVIPLWYIKFLADVNPSTIVDIGCGRNLFKSVIKKLFNINVHGIDPTPNNLFADEFDFFNLEFSNGHANAYESVFSINALHFVPLSYMTQRIMEFYNIIKPTGHGFLALNSARMIERSDHQWLVDTFNDVNPTQIQIQDYICNELSTLNIDFIVKDILIIDDKDENMDGNIRLVFKK